MPAGAEPPTTTEAPPLIAAIAGRLDQNVERIGLDQRPGILGQMSMPDFEPS